MTLAHFIDYLNMDHAEDMTYRAYDLLHGAGERRVILALRLLGYQGIEPGLAIPDLEAQLHARGQAADDIRARLCEWYIWQRINAGVYSQWKYRSA